MNRSSLTRDGVGPSAIFLPDGDWQFVFDFLCEKFPGVARAEWQKRFESGLVLNANGEPIEIGQRYQAQKKILYYRALEKEISIPFEAEILFQDEHILVADKPHFLPVTPAGNFVQETLLVRLKRQTGIESLSPMHRIDRETAGLVVFVIKPSLRGAYQVLLQSDAVQKTYQAIAPFRAELEFPLQIKNRLQESAHFMQMEEVDGESNSQTQIELLQTNGEYAHYQLTPLTGKKHQLRVHMAGIGIPILHDTIYPLHQVAAPGDFSKPLQLLAQKIEFVDPISKIRHRFESKRKLMSLQQFNNSTLPVKGESSR